VPKSINGQHSIYSYHKPKRNPVEYLYELASQLRLFSHPIYKVVKPYFQYKHHGNNRSPPKEDYYRFKRNPRLISRRCIVNHLGPTAYSFAT